MANSLQNIRQRARQAISEQPYRTVTILSSLLAVHDALGYLPSEAVEEVAVSNGTSTNEVWGVASFYPNFRYIKPPKHTVQVCWGPTCHILGAQRIVHKLLSHLGIEREDDTPDGMISFRLNTCLGACPHGPVIQLNDTLRGGMDSVSAVELVEDLKRSNVGQDMIEGSR